MTVYQPSGEGDVADGTPRHPAAPQKRGAGKPTPDKPVSATRQGNKDKFAWYYEMLADPTVSLAAKVVGAGCCMKMAGSKGHFKATRKVVANLCGISQSTVRRGLADLIDKRFLTADIHEGAASTYRLVLPAQRWEIWFRAECEYHSEINRLRAKMESWLWAEKRHQEEQFRDAVYEVSMARGADEGRARWISDRLVDEVSKRGWDFDVAKGFEWVAAQKPELFVPADDEFVPDGGRADPGTPESRPRYAREPGSVCQRADPGTPESRGRLTPDEPTSADDQTHKSFKDSERPVKVFQDSESEAALRDALTRAPRPVRASAGVCELCGPNGLFLDAYDNPVVLISDDDEDCTEYPVKCQHSMASNLAEIQRLEKTEGLGLCKTGWPEIDGVA